MDRNRQQREQEKTDEVKVAYRQVKEMEDKLEFELKKIDDVRAAFNADKKALQEKVEHLEQQVKVKL